MYGKEQPIEEITVRCVNPLETNQDSKDHKLTEWKISAAKENPAAWQVEVAGRKQI